MQKSRYPTLATREDKETQIHFYLLRNHLKDYDLMTITKALLPLAFFALYAELQGQQTLYVNNIDPRQDMQGEIIDAHDGRVIRFGDVFYWYGTRYGNTNGFTTANRYVCYSSRDMQHWKKEGPLLQDQPPGVYYRPHVVYNEKTKKYVLWYNWYPKLWDGQFAVATSDTPTGPFIIQNANVRMAYSDKGLGDLGLFVDHDGTAYVSYNTIHNHEVSIEKLDEHYTSSTLQNGGVIAQHMEAGAMFRRNGKYYLLTDYTCCFCNYGSGARVYISNEPLRGYQYTGNINRHPGKLSPALTDGITVGNVYAELQKQEDQWQGIQIELPGKETIDRVEVSLFTGNRPENCGDVSNPRVHPPINTPRFELKARVNNTWKSLPVIDLLTRKKALKEDLVLNIGPILTDKIVLLPRIPDHDNLYVYEVGLKKRNKSVSGTAKAYLIGQSIPQRPIIPAQQTYVLELPSSHGPEFIWMGDLWGSASDNVKGHDYQYWSAPLEFDENGHIRTMEWKSTWTLEIK